MNTNKIEKNPTNTKIKCAKLLTTYYYFSEWMLKVYWVTLKKRVFFYWRRLYFTIPHTYHPSFIARLTPTHDAFANTFKNPSWWHRTNGISSVLIDALLREKICGVCILLVFLILQWSIMIFINLVIEYVHYI